jgi:hypothetical protein
MMSPAQKLVSQRASPSRPNGPRRSTDVLESRTTPRIERPRPWPAHCLLRLMVFARMNATGYTRLAYVRVFKDRASCEACCAVPLRTHETED